MLNLEYIGVLHETSDHQSLEFKLADGNFNKEQKPWKWELYYVDIVRVLFPTKISPCYFLISHFPFYDSLEFCCTVWEAL